MEIVFGIVATIVFVCFVYYTVGSLLTLIFEEMGGHPLWAFHVPGILGTVFMVSGIANPQKSLSLGFQVWWFGSAGISILISLIIVIFFRGFFSDDVSQPEARTVSKHRIDPHVAEIEAQLAEAAAAAGVKWKSPLGTRSSLNTRATAPSEDGAAPVKTELQSRWKVEKTELGRGAFKAVFKARRQFGPDKTNFQTAAIAKLRSATPSKFEVRRFRQEQVVLSTLDHANCIRLIDWPKAKSREYWFATEFVGSYNLRDLLASPGKSRPLSRQQTLLYSRQLLAGLAHVHRKNIVHADIKLDNVLLTRDAESVRLADFGLAFFVDKPETYTFGGTLIYMAPEVLASHIQHKQDQTPPESPTRASDVYSVGLAILELVAGRNAWNGLSETEILDAILNKGPRWDGIPSNVADFLKPILAPNPKKRPTVQRVLQHLTASNFAPWPKGSPEALVAHEYSLWQQIAFKKTT